MYIFAPICFYLSFVNRTFQRLNECALLHTYRWVRNHISACLWLFHFVLLYGFCFVVSVTTFFHFFVVHSVSCSHCSYVTIFRTHHAMENRTIHTNDEFNGAKKWKESLLNLVFGRLTDWKSKATANNVELSTTTMYMKQNHGDYIFGHFICCPIQLCSAF